MQNNYFLESWRCCLSWLLLIGSTSLSAHSMDPLTDVELAKATQLAQMVNTPKRSARANPDAALANIFSTSELLLVERHMNAKGDERRLADVYTYDYTHDETLINLVDLNNQTVITTQRRQQLQLPLTSHEIQRATELVFNHSIERNLLNTEYQRITGKILTNPSELAIKAFVFTADSLPNQLNAASQQCGVQRCAQLLLYTQDAVVFERIPIVNLSTGVITQTIGF